MKTLPIVAVVTRETRMEGLKKRWVTSSALAFRMEQASDHEEQRLKRRARKSKGMFKDEDLTLLAAEAADALSDESDLKDEDSVYKETLKELLFQIDLGYPIKEVNRKYVSNFDFQRCAAVVVFGQDGLVANVAKYVRDVPIIGVNPDPGRYDGILLPYEVRQARTILQKTLNDKVASKAVTLAEVSTNDGQKMLAFNDFFLGCKSHTSARYTVEYNFQTEPQSSSGMIVSTGAGSTGWMSSVFNMAERLNGLMGIDAAQAKRPRISMEDSQLIWAVREPFISNRSSAQMVGGVLEMDDELVVGSQMDGNGVIFSDGIESDFIEFNSGSIAAFRVAEQKAHLVVG